MRTVLVGCCVVLASACGGDDSADFDPPTAEDLYGEWTAPGDDGDAVSFEFARTDDGSHPELAGVTDVYVIGQGAPGSVVEQQTGHFEIAVREVTGHGMTDALVTSPLSGAGTGGEFGNAFLGYTGMTFTISSTAAVSGQRTYRRL